MKMFLTGGGDEEFFSSLDKKFIEVLPDGAKILVLPLACDSEDYQYVLERVQECFASKKVGNVDLFKRVSELDMESFLSFDAVFIEGGNTFQLIREVRDSYLFEYLKAFIKQKKIVYADSAGAIIQGLNVESAFLGDEADEDVAKLQDFRGLGLLGKWSVHCHYSPSDFEPMEDLMYSTGSPLLALPETVGIYINEDQVTVGGDGSLDVVDFVGRKSYPSGTTFSIDWD